MEPPFLLYNGDDNVYLERLEIICTYKMLGMCRHSGNGASKNQGGGKLFQEEGAAARTIGGRLRKPDMHRCVFRRNEEWQE